MAQVGSECASAPHSVSTEDTDVGDATLLGLPVELQKMILEHVRPDHPTISPTLSIFMVLTRCSYRPTPTKRTYALPAKDYRLS
jgi:hypothetical protein